MQRYYAVSKKPIPLGYAGENLAREIAFDLKELKSIYGDGSAQLMVRRAGEDVRYPVSLTVDGDFAIWKVTEADSAIPGCDGSCELSYTTENGVLAKSETWATFVLASMTCDTCDPPEVAENWMSELRKSAAETQFNADSAAASAVTAEEWAKKAEEFANSSGTGGGTGTNGKDGKDGKDGVGITSIKRTSGDGSPGTTDTYTITLTDDSTYTFTVYNGADGEDGVGGEGGGANGKDGITPHIGSNGNWFLGDTDTGIKAKGEDGTDGKDGQNGSDGENGKDGSDGITPHIGENKNWFIGETDTGVKAEGTDGADGSSLDVYSTEETVVGTWIDGKPLYRRTILASITCATSSKDTDLCSISGVHLCNAFGVAKAKTWDGEYSIPYCSYSSSKHYIFMLRYESGAFKLQHCWDGTRSFDIEAVFEYTKDADTAAVSTTSLMDAYEEGVNEA